MSSTLAALVAGLTYPTPDTLDLVARSVEGLPTDTAKREVGRFVAAVTRLEMGEWEELHTRTVDLSPLFVPYVGHLVWGESYRRGAFMADLQRAQRDAGVDQHGELPDHLVPILEYLDAGVEPITDLVEALPQAVDTMRKDLRKSEPDNPYRHLLAAVASAVDAWLPEGASA